MHRGIPKSSEVRPLALWLALGVADRVEYKPGLSGQLSRAVAERISLGVPVVARRAFDVSEPRARALGADALAGDGTLATLGARCGWAPSGRERGQSTQGVPLTSSGTRPLA